MAKSVAFHTLGCRLNFSETGSVTHEFLKRGYKLVPFGEKADVTFINTCTVTDEADSSCRYLIRKAHRASPEGKLVVAGCYAQMEPQRISEIKGVDLILGTQEKYKVFDYLKEEKENRVFIDQTDEFWGTSSVQEEGRTRAFLKIQDGCNYICSFCIIPFARGRSRTIGVEEAVSQAKSLTAQGFQEIVLTGVNIGEYERSSGERLSDLIQRVSEVDGLKRLRLSSVEPNTITEELLTVLKDCAPFQPHFHIPLQSGSDKILKLMRRKYLRHDYLEVLARVKSYFPEAAIGADMIVGHPGETEEDFGQTYELAQNYPLTHFHVFPYSKRQKTLSARREDHIPYEVKKERAQRLRLLGEKKLASFAHEFIGQKVSILWERNNKGLTSQFLKVKSSDKRQQNTLTEEVIRTASDGHLEIVL